ncbi:glycine/D-amino acid oxidase-like deaminating enzyme [Serratia fonticola]|uniref:Glycine/D-amino acid oxidase-like deaminating enzyme n=1 Tax=Serratia fonticola TaxID=47917 RepID=A0A559T2Q6_SERFO|nr:glycine/D-amino acid oxidase-like deaminating enzyme [Serratia fonticola]TQI99364.1 glycine/D-amino acid oxidase-like deaminating enzyme [Serratia fonticola]TVZ68888.1 glycine/D-amino acid oxidase-like deaminating enzyme [Serratia fonticola]
MGEILKRMLRLKYASVPLNQNQNGWLKEERLPTAFPPLIGDADADWVVVGSGFAGVSFARRLASLDPSLKIIVIDSACAAESSSARNSGFIIGLPHNIGSSTAELKKAQSYRSLLQEGINQLTTQIEQHKIECEWENVGKYHCQVDATNERVLKEYTDNLDLMNEPYQVLAKEALYQKLGTHFYNKGIYTPSSILVNPASLIVGLAHSLPQNVTVYNHTPVMAIRHGTVSQVLTPYGTLRAANVMLATNALSRELAPITSQQAAMATFASITAPLTPEQRQKLPAMSSWGLTPVNAIAGATLRYTQDHRFLIRQHVTPALHGRITAAQTYQATQLHKQIFHKVYPQLGDVPLTRTWSGTISVTRNGAPVWGALKKGIYTAGGCNGAGVSKQTIAGTLLADYALGQDHPLIGAMQALGKANYLPPSPVLDIAIAVSLMKERYLGRHEI